MPARIQVVRCSSNVYSELTYRSLLFWAPELDAAKRKFLTTLERKVSEHDMGYHPVIAEKVDWSQQRQTELASAYELPDDDTYDELADYLSLRSKRKELEAQQEAMKANEDAIALELASHLGDAAIGYIANPATGGLFTVRHTEAPGPRAWCPTPEFIRQNKPELADCIKQEPVIGEAAVDVL